MSLTILIKLSKTVSGSYQAPYSHQASMEGHKGKLLQLHQHLVSIALF